MGLNGFPKISNVTTWIDLILVLVRMVSLLRAMSAKLVHVVVCLFGD